MDINHSVRPRALLWGILSTAIILTAVAGGLRTFFRARVPLPDFEHIVLVVLENREYSQVIGNADMPFFNQLARENVLLAGYHGVQHPSLPNYIALITGDTYGIQNDCLDCYLDVPSLPEQIQISGRTWKAYLEDLPEPCYTGGNVGLYAKRHNPFVYIDQIRQDRAGCEQAVMPLDQLEKDLAKNNLPDFAMVVPNVCNDSHDCELDVTDSWLETWIPRLLAYPGLQKNSLLVITFDEGTSGQSCCGFKTSGGRVAAVLISPQAQSGYVDHTEYNHYSLLKTIETAWQLELLGNARHASLILDPWIQKNLPWRSWMP